MNIVLSTDRGTVEVPQFTTVKDVLLKAGYTISGDYASNPIVAVWGNGMSLPLSYCLKTNGKLTPIYAHQSQGRRVYRHSLCFLLSYAAKLVFPFKNLVIGHSLGDGFYYSFENGKMTEEETKAIERSFERLVSLKLPIENRYMSLKEAHDYFVNARQESTWQLLSSENDCEVEYYAIEDYRAMAYEPLVSNTSVLSVWEIRNYEKKGLLLRYPVSSDVLKIVPFRENPRLFEVFEQSKNWGKILKVRTVAEMNKRILDGSVGEYVRLCESLQRRKIASIADDVLKRGAKAVFIAGPSSSGKTTFAKKLCEQLRMLGQEPIRISLDDYYIPRVDIPKNSKGEPDYECLEALRVDQFFENMKDIFEGKAVHLPIWNFSKQVQTLRSEETILTDKTIFVIEGIHGLNKKITCAVDEKSVYKVYISALTQLNIDDQNRVSTTDNRIIRRIVRDNRTRGVSAIETLEMWSDVEKGERLHVFPNQNNADVMFNSALDYELGVLSPFVCPLLKEVSPDNEVAYRLARRLLAFLDNIYAVPSHFVPTDSILREFIGMSDYE